MRPSAYLLIPLAWLAACAPPPHSTVSAPAGVEESGVGPEIASPAPRENSEVSAVVPSTAVVVEAARARLGRPYRFGGQGPGGYDCSGLVQQVYREVGISLPRTAARQARVGRVLHPAEFQPGDLVLFGQNGHVDHIGIWIGGGRFVHASSRRGVVIDSLDTAWFRQRLLGGRRVLEEAR